MSEATTILISGDVTVDHHIYHGGLASPSLDASKGVQAVVENGGAIVLGALIVATFDAAKYAAGAADRRVGLHVLLGRGRVELHLRDRGPGVPLPHDGFDRGSCWREHRSCWAAIGKCEADLFLFQRNRGCVHLRRARNDNRGLC